MAKSGKKQSFRSIVFSSDDASLELYDSIKKLAEKGLEGKEYLTYDELLFQLRRWWCHYYKRPYKDPLLDAYTMEELLFEYFDVTNERSGVSEKKVSEAIEAEDRDWAEEEARREEEEAAAKTVAEAEKVAVAEPTPENDTIVEEAVGLTDSQWADKHEKVLVNPTADQIDSEDGDISAKFEG